MQKRLKILYIANARIPTEKAHGIQIMQMLDAFANSKLEIELIIPWRFNPIKTDPFDYYGVKRIFKITKLPCLDLVRFGKLGFLIETISFLISVKIYLLFRKYAILYSRDWPVSLFFNNIVLETHSLPKKITRLHKKAWKRAKALVVLTNFIKESLIKSGILAEKIIIAPDGVDIEKFKNQKSKIKIREELNLPLDKKIAVYTGHLYEWKGIDTLIEAGRILDKNVLIYLVGGTPRDITNYKLQITNYKNIELAGHQPHSEIPLWLKAADVLVLPNSAKEDISKYYTSPMKLFEYMASKRPIIASDLPSLREILSEKNAILIPPDNAQALADGIEKILADERLAKELSTQAFIDVQNYTWEKRAENILKFICQ